jgi:hypothetical protein
MATIVIKDLPENTDLDRDAMRAVLGGSRLRSRPGIGWQSRLKPVRIVDLRAGGGGGQKQHGKPA